MPGCCGVYVSTRGNPWFTRQWLNSAWTAVMRVLIGRRAAGWWAGGRGARRELCSSVTPFSCIAHGTSALCQVPYLPASLPVGRFGAFISSWLKLHCCGGRKAGGTPCFRTEQTTRWLLPGYGMHLTCMFSQCLERKACNLGALWLRCHSIQHSCMARVRHAVLCMRAAKKSRSSQCPALSQGTKIALA